MTSKHGGQQIRLHGLLTLTFESARNLACIENLFTALQLSLDKSNNTNWVLPEVKLSVASCLLFWFRHFKLRRFNVAYGVGKAGVDRLAKDMAVGET